MKQISRLLSFAAAAAMCFSACSPEELKNGEVNVSKFVTVHFGTENTDPASTKATLIPTDEYETAFQAAWVNGDAIKVEYSNDSESETATGTTTATWNGTSFESKMPEYTGMWTYDAAYPVPSESDSSVDFGPNRTQKGNAYNSKYDIMIGSAVAEKAAAGKDKAGKDIVFMMTRQTAIAYFHFTSELDEAVTSATLKVTDGAIANSSASINEYFKFVAPQENDLTEINLTFEEGTAPSAKDFQLWFNVLPTTYNVMTLTVETATKSFTIRKDTKGELDMYEAGKLYKVKKSGIAWTDKVVTPSGPTITKITSALDFTAGTYIIMTHDESYYVPNAAATNAGPELGNVVKTDGVITITPEMIWNATVSPEGLEFTSYVEPNNKLWGAPTSDGVRVNKTSTANNPSSVWKLETVGDYGLCGYAAGSGTEKYYLSTYGTKDWRNYKSSNLSTTNKAANFFKVEGWVDPNHSISVATVYGGTLSASTTSAAEGTVVTLTATPNEGFELTSWEVVDSDANVIEVDDNKFTMPAANVTVSGTFSKIDYSITKTKSDRGSIVAKKGDAEVEKAQIGDEITLVANPNEGYELKSWTVVYGEDKSIEVVDNKFTMPASDVTVTATFRSNALYTVSFNVNGIETTKHYKESEKIEFPADPKISGVTFMGWITKAIEGTQAAAPDFVDTSSAVMGTEDLTYYAVFATQGTEKVSETIGQTLAYDTWTYSGSTTDKSSYRLFHTDSYIESAEFDLSTLTKVVVYGGTFGGDSYNKLTISDGTNTWKEVTVSGDKQTGKNTYKDGTPLSGTGKLRITSNSGKASSNGVRISKIEIYVGVYGYTDYCTKVVTLSSVTVSGAPSKTEYTVDEAFDPKGLTVTGTYSNGSTAAITEGISWNWTPATFTEAENNKTVSVTATVKSVASEVYNVDVTVKARKLSPPANLKCSEKTESSLTFTWNEVDKASDYQVSTDGGTTYSSTQKANTYTWTGLTADTSYTLYVKAIGDGTNYTDSDAAPAEDKTTAGGSTGGETTYSYLFKSKTWTATLNGETANWTSGKDGNGYNNNGVQVTTGVSGANATSPDEFTNVSKIVVRYCTNKDSGKGTVTLKVGENTFGTQSISAPKSGGTTEKSFEISTNTPCSGNVNIKVDCTTNSIYIIGIDITAK